MYTMLPNESDQGTIEYWVEDLLKDPIVSEIIHSRSFKRLYKISFLGALDHVAPFKGLSKGPRSRAHHSLYVAGIANYVAAQRAYPDDLRRHLVIAGLLHDIGHPPLSHSVEPYLKEKFGLGHHELGEMALDEMQSKEFKNKKIPEGYIDIKFISTLINKKASDMDGGDLFKSPINIDTIDGIIRTYSYLTKSSSNLDRIIVAESSFLSKDKSRYRILDKFWKLKNFVYKNIINNELGIAADTYSQAYFMDKENILYENHLTLSEISWNKEFNSLFLNLNKININSSLPGSITNKNIDFIDREYEIDKTAPAMNRYKLKKKISNMKIGKRLELYTS